METRSHPDELNLRWYTPDAITKLKKGDGGVYQKGFSDEQISEIISSLKSDSKSLFGRNFTQDEVLIVLCVACQKYKLADDSAQWKVSVLEDTKYFSIQKIKTYLTKTLGFPSRPSAIKVLQNTIPNEIFCTSKWLKLPGNLSNLVDQVEDADDYYWMSDFQLSNNNCPGHVKFKIKRILDGKKLNTLRNKLK